MKYIKSIFNEWNIEKQTIHEKNMLHIFIKPGTIWFCSIGQNIGYEENGKGKGFTRPVLVLEKLGNTYLVVPLTTGGKENHHFYYTITSIGFNKPSRVILNQIKTIDKKRFIHHKASITGIEFTTIKKILKNMCFPGL